MKIKKPRYLKKETLARNIVRNHLHNPERNPLDRFIQEVYDARFQRFILN